MKSALSSGSEPLHRVFIAFPLHHVSKKSYQKILTEVQSVSETARIVPFSNAHCTLRFFPGLSVSQIESIKKILENVRGKIDICETKWRRVGFFRDSNSVWLGPTHSEPALNNAHKIISHTLNEFGFELPARTFVPHITFARLTEKSGKAKIAVKKESSIRLIESAIPLVFDKIALYQSRLGGPIPRYSVLHQVSLNG